MMSGSDKAENLAWQANKPIAECNRYVSAVHCNKKQLKKVPVLLAI